MKEKPDSNQVAEKYKAEGFVQSNIKIKYKGILMKR